MKLKKGDKVIVISGANKGKTGTITKVFRDEDKVIVEGVNLKKKHQKAVGQNPAGIIEIEAPIHVSNVAIFDEKSKGASRISYKFDKKGKKIRVATKSGTELK